MRDCKHLDITPAQQIRPGLYSPPVALCALKTDVATRIKLANAAAGELGTMCPPNTECHYYAFDLCEKCPSYAK